MSDSHPIIYEPTTTITDFLIFFLGCYYSWFLIKITGSVFHLFWGFSFFILSIGALLGGISHGFGPKLSELVKIVIWKSTLFFVGLAALVIFFSVVLVFTNGSINFLMLLLLVFVFIFFLYNVFKHDSFLGVVKFYLPILIVSSVCFLYIFVFKGYTGALFIFVGILVTLAASLIQTSKIAIHKHFNHNDFFHVLQMISMYLMYEGGLEMPKI